MSVPRLLPDVALPPYTFVPGRFPHPVSDPAGHSYGRRPAAAPCLRPEDWPRSRTYLFALDLFNTGYYWECHEQVEGLWRATGRGPARDFLKGLIKLAAAGVKHLEGRPAGIRSHACRAAELFQAVVKAQGEGHCAGLSVPGLLDLARAICRDGWPADPPLLLPNPDAGSR